MMAALRSGSWLTPQRLRLVPMLLAGMTVASLAILFLTANGTVDAYGRPLGTDFSNVWAAGWMANHGDAPAAWDWAREYAVEQRFHGAATPFYGWHYPPPFLLIAALLASLPYLPALLVYQAATLGSAVVVVRRIVPDRRTTLLALGFPAVFVCLGHGQNGFLTAALLGGGMLLLDRRPLLAGLVLGCLCYKPQFAPVLPVLLLAGGHWRAAAGAVLSVGVLVALTVGLWGIDVWQAFAQSLPLTRTVVVEAADTGAYKIVSAFAAIRLNGGSLAAAYVTQGCMGVLAVSAIVAMRRARPCLRHAAGAAATLLATPYAFDYDLVLLGIGIAFLVADARDHAWLPWDKSLLAMAYLTPLFARATTQWTGIPFGLLAILAVFLIAVRRAAPAVLADPAVTWLRSSPSRRLHGAFVR